MCSQRLKKLHKQYKEHYGKDHNGILISVIAINYGYYRYDTGTMLVTVALMVVIVQLIQSGGTSTVKHTDKRKK